MISLSDILGAARTNSGQGSGGVAATDGLSSQDFAKFIAGMRLGKDAASAASAGVQGGKSAAQGGTAGGEGLQQKGASAAELLATRVRLAGGLRAFEAETLQALREAAASGQSAAQVKTAQGAVLQGAAKALGALLGQADAALGTDMVDRLHKVLSALSQEKDGQAAAGKAEEGQSDPSALAGALFALVAQTLGLVRPVANGQATRSQLLLEAAGAQNAGQTAGQSVPAASGVGGDATAQGTDPGRQLGPLVRTLAHAASDARHEAKQSAVTGSDVAAKTGATQAKPADPFAQMLSGPTQVSGQAAAAAGSAVAASSAPVAATAPAAAQAAAPNVAPAPTAAFAGFVANQIRSADVSDGVTRIALKPRGLGEIELDMKRDSSGRLNVVLRVENPMVLAALRNDQMRLSEMFSASGMAGQGGSGQNGASLDFQSFGERGGQASQDKAGQIGAAGAASALAEDGAATPVAQDTIGRGALDIRI